ncbi:MAG: T9SS type A sorting domain-containing protein [Saprospiraceae bacterium]|nr:T9SS type A sorting domain-containing protein [Saprospiraceae bacterium]
MKRHFLIAFSLLISFSITAQNWQTVRENPSPKTRIDLLSSNIESSTLMFSFDRFELIDISVNGKSSSIPMLDEATSLLIKDAPDLKKLTASVIIPDMAEMSVKVISSSFKDFKNINIAPSKGNLTRDINPNTVPYSYGKAYKENKFFPDVLASLNDPYILRDYRAQTIVVYPFQYNPITKTLRVYYDITVKISKKSNNGKNQFVRNNQPKKLITEYSSIYQYQFKNYSNSSKYTAVSEVGNMLIISDTNYMATMQPLVDWKNQSGRKTEIVNVASIGTTASAIKAYVTNYYNTKGLTFLLLVGDAAQIPTNTLSSGHSDNAYGYLTGNDSYPELFVGRFSAQTIADAQTQVERTITYELNPNVSGAYGKCVGIASEQGPGDDNEYDYEHIRNMQTDLMAYTYNQKFEFFDGSQGGLDASGDPSPSQVATTLNSGAGLVLYTGHGSTTAFSSSGFSNSNVNNLTNTEVLPFIWSVACVNGNFVSNTCFAEAWLRATNNSNPTGAIATLMSTINQSWDPPMDAQDEMVDILVETYSNNIKRTFGGLSMNGCMKMIDDYNTQGATMADTWNIFGDPSLMIRTDTPQAIVVTHTPTVFLGANQFQINCNENGALAALTINNQIIGTGLVSGGTVNISFSALTNIDTMKLVVTAYNKIPYVIDIPIIAAIGPYVTLKANTINDLNGNNNAQADFGESIQLNVILENIGISVANGVSAILSTNDQYITIIDSTANWGNIVDSTTSTQINAYSVSIANNVPDNHTAIFELKIQDSNSNNWTSSLNLLINAPKFQVGNLTVDDFANGNGNGKLEPGETATITIESKNIGHSKCSNVIGLLTSSSMKASVINAYFQLDTLDANSSKNASFTVKVDSTLPLGTTFGLIYDFGAGAYNTQHTFYIEIGVVDEDFESGDFSKFNWGVTISHPWTISTEAYAGQYCMKSGVINNSQSTIMSLTLDVLIDDTISFYKKVSCENDPWGEDYDFLEFFINNTSMGKWDGIINWSKEEFAVAAGTTIFKWVYTKDNMQSAGSDCAWIDNIIFPPIATPASINDVERNMSFEIYPNPFKDKFTLKIENPIQSKINIEIYNSFGQVVKSVYNNLPIGQQSIDVNCMDLNSGLYFCRIITKDYSETKKIILTR